MLKFWSTFLYGLALLIDGAVQGRTQLRSKPKLKTDGKSKGKKKGKTAKSSQIDDSDFTEDDSAYSNFLNLSY